MSIGDPAPPAGAVRRQGTRRQSPGFVGQVQAPVQSQGGPTRRQAENQAYYSAGAPTILSSPSQGTLPSRPAGTSSNPFSAQTGPTRSQMDLFRGSEVTDADRATDNRWSMITGMYAPQLTSLANQATDIRSQIQLANANQAYQSRLLGDQYGMDQARLDLRAAANQRALGDVGQDRMFLGRRSDLYDDQLANTLAGFGLDRQQIDLARQGIVNDETRLKLKMAGLDVDELLAKDTSARDARALANRQAAGGAWFSPEHGLGRQDIKTDMDAALTQIDLARQGVGVDRADLDLARQKLDLDLQRVGLSESAARLARLGQQINLDENAANLSRTERDIIAAAEELGIDRQQLNATLNQAMSQLGYDTQLQLMAAGGDLEQIGADVQATYEQMITEVFLMTILGEGGG